MKVLKVPTEVRDLYHFYAQYGRWPTWADAVAHCEPEMQAIWKEELIARRAWSEPEPAP
jgi:hypothetical protein